MQARDDQCQHDQTGLWRPCCEKRLRASAQRLRGGLPGSSNWLRLFTMPSCFAGIRDSRWVQCSRIGADRSIADLGIQQGVGQIDQQIHGYRQHYQHHQTQHQGVVAITRTIDNELAQTG